MTLRAVQSRTFADQIFSQLAAEIMAGRYAPGENLPSERTLAEVFHVNRQVVREGLKKIAVVERIHAADRRQQDVQSGLFGEDRELRLELVAVRIAVARMTLKGKKAAGLVDELAEKTLPVRHEPDGIVIVDLSGQ